MLVVCVVLPYAIHHAQGSKLAGQQNSASHSDVDQRLLVDDRMSRKLLARWLRGKSGKAFL